MESVMYLRRFVVIAGMAIGLLSGEARACEYEPFLFQLPGETAEAAEERSSAILSDNAILRRTDRENDAFKKAVNIYLARKVDTLAEPATHARVSVVRPVGTIRGLAP